MPSGVDKEKEDVFKYGVKPLIYTRSDIYEKYIKGEFDEYKIWISSLYTPLSAENIDKNSYCLISCATTPKFQYEGFRLVGQAEIKTLFKAEYEKVKHLAFPDS